MYPELPGEAITRVAQALGEAIADLGRAAA
jgi:hypothetical protein